MKLIKPSEWITPAKNREGVFGDSFPPGVHLITALQAVTYPIAAAITGVGAIFTKGK